MKLRAWFSILVVAFLLAACSERPDALRVFIVAPQSSPANGEPDAQQFAAEWKKLLSERGAVVKVGPAIPSAGQLRSVHVLVLYGRQAASIRGEEPRLESFTQRGGGLVFLHDAVSAGQANRLLSLAGGTAEAGQTNWPAGATSLYFGAYAHAITEGLSNFDLDDGYASRVQLEPRAHVLASTFNATQQVVPQVWAFESDTHRAFAALLGRRTATFQQPHVRGLLLRAVAWTARRDIDSLTREDERAHFAYPEGGPTAPDKAAATIKVQPEFDLSLVAAEPLVVKPLALDWDARGRLWVAIAPGQPAGGAPGRLKDGVIILEDANGDGRMDTRRVFYEAQRPVTALVCHRDGVIVAQPPQIVWLADRDGDGVPDQREVLYEGFGTNDVLASLSGFRWGLDGWVYAAQGRSGADTVNVVDKDGQSLGPFGTGILRFKPDGTLLEMVSAFTNNCWGLDFTWDGDLFFPKAGGSHLSYLALPERFIDAGRPGAPQADKSIPDHQRLFPLLTNRPGDPDWASLSNAFGASAGALVYDGGAWPMKYQGSYFVCEPAARVLHEDLLVTTESLGFEAARREETEFVAATDPWFRPLQAQVGPDGAMYLIDFYSQAPFAIDGGESRPDRDITHGRIWRLQHRAARRLDVPMLDKAPTSVLVKALEHPNRWVRLTAQRLLSEEGSGEAADRLVPLLTNRLAYVQVLALWTLHRLNALPERGLIQALTNSPHLLVQRAALRVAEDQRAPLATNLAKAVFKQLRETDERTRLLAILALTHSVKDTNVQQTALKMFPDLKDPYARAAVLALARRVPMDVIKSAFASDKSESYRELVGVLVEDYARNGQVTEAAQVIRLAAAHPTTTEKLSIAVLQVLTRFLGPDFEPVWSQELEAAVQKLFTAKSRSLRLANLAFATHWTNKPAFLSAANTVRDEMLAELKNPKLKDEERIALVTNLFAVKFLQPHLYKALDEMLGSNSPPAVQKQIVAELSRVPEKEAGALLIRKYSLFAEELRPVLFTAILRHAAWAQALLEALENQEIPVQNLDVLGINRLRTYPVPAVADKARAVFDSVGGAPKQDRAAVLAGLKSVLAKPGDPNTGRPVYRQHCLGCHHFPGHAPVPDWSIDLTGATALGPAFLLDRLLDPNRAADPRWLAWNVSTTNGGHHFGALGKETKDTLVVRNVEGDHEIKRSEIAATNCTGVSLMPEGYEMLGEAALRDLLAYLMGKAPKGFHVLDLAGACTADTRRAVFSGESEKPEIEFKRFGLVMVEGIPFRLVNPAGTTNGNNLVVLQGGSAQNYPQRVEVPVNTKAARLHVLGGVAGWGFPFGVTNQPPVPAATLAIQYADGQSEETVFHNGAEFADYVRPIEVPGSKLASNLVVNGQLRWFTVEPKGKGRIDKLVLESPTNHLAPVFVAITAQE